MVVICVCVCVQSVAQDMNANGLDEDDAPPEALDEADGQVERLEYVIKHPLKHMWSWWYFVNDRSKNWCDNNKVVICFSTVEDFWSVYNWIIKASKLITGCDYSIFKNDIQPMWEDPENKDGGRWLINVSKNQRQADLDTLWLETLLCLIGEAFDDYGDEITGAVVNIRQKGDKVSVWTRDCTQSESIMHIGRTLKERLRLPKTCMVGYQAHSDTSTKTGSTVKNRYQV